MQTTYLLTYLTANAFNRLDQHAGSPGNRTYCYAELVSSLEKVIKKVKGKDRQFV